jgi:hypothetical protein
MAIRQPSFEQTLLNQIAARNPLALSLLCDLTGYQLYSIARCFLSDEEANIVVFNVYAYIWNHVDDHDCTCEAIMPWLIAVTEMQARHYQSSLPHVRRERTAPGLPTLRRLTFGAPCN